nr:alkaline phosphatase [Polycladospora coralii]
MPTYALNGQDHFRFSRPIAKNVILFVGDGMGPDHRDAIRMHSVGLNEDLAMDLAFTGSAGSFQTDSGTAATAMATGVKTTKRTIGMNPDGKGSDEQFTIDWTTGGHTGGHVLLTAEGPGAQYLTGEYENTYIFNVIRHAMRLRR